MSLIIRPGVPADYASAADIHIRAFGERTDEAVIVALLRQRQTYDPELSLIAERDGHTEYYAQVQSGKRPPGRPIWGTAFELA